MDSLEVEQSWKEEEFDFVLQFLRTILMKREHGLVTLSHDTTDRSRRRIANIYVYFCAQLASYTPTFNPWYTLTTEEASAQTQRH